MTASRHARRSLDADTLSRRLSRLSANTLTRLACQVPPSTNLVLVHNQKNLSVASTTSSTDARWIPGVTGMSVGALLEGGATLSVATPVAPSTGRGATRRIRPELSAPSGRRPGEAPVGLSDRRLPGRVAMGRPLPTPDPLRRRWTSRG